MKVIYVEDYEYVNRGFEIIFGDGWFKIDGFIMGSVWVLRW